MKEPLATKKGKFLFTTEGKYGILNVFIDYRNLGYFRYFTVFCEY